jgi:hypothetical protein
MATKPQYYWFDDSDSIVVGTFDTEAAARECAEDSAGYDGNHTRTYTVVKVISTSGVPSLKRKWSAA